MNRVLRARTNEEWYRELNLPPPECNSAIEDLRLALILGLNAAFSHSRHLSREAVEDFAQEALTKVLSELESFRGECRLISWATKIAINHSLTALRRHQWRDVSLEDLSYPDRFLSGDEAIEKTGDPERRAIQKSLMDTINRAISEKLTEKQKRAMVAIGIHGMSLEEVARRLGTNRNSLYKLMHDARKRLKQALESQGLHMIDIQEVFG